MSRSCAKYGEREAVLQCLRLVWSQHMELHGVEEADVLVQGLFGLADESALAAASVLEASVQSQKKPRVK